MTTYYVLLTTCLQCLIREVCTHRPHRLAELVQVYIATSICGSGICGGMIEVISLALAALNLLYPATLSSGLLT